MSVIRISTSFNIDIDFTAPPFHQRMLAWIIDVFILMLYSYVAIRILLGFTKGSFDEGKMTELMAVFLLLILPILTYHLVCEILMNGQSVGKRIMRIRVVNENGGRPGIGQFIIRWLIRTSDYMAIVIIFTAVESANAGNSISAFMQIGAAFCLFVLDVILVNSSKKHQRLGDMLAHTILIKTRQRTNIDDTIFLQVADNYKPSYPQVMHLSDRDINALKSILDSSKKHHDFDLAANASEKIKSHLNIQTSLSPFDFLEVLLKDYNYLAGK